MSKTIIKYLTGEGVIDGYSFGETVPGRSPFWWRFHLREYEAARDKEIEDLKNDLIEAKNIINVLIEDYRLSTIDEAREFLDK